VTVVIGLIFFSLTYLGIRKARQSLLKIMVDEARALMEGLALSSSNAIQAGLLLESLTEEKFADVAEAARFRLADTEDPDDFRMFGEESGLLSIDFLDSNNAIVGSDRWAVGFVPSYPAEVQAELHDIQQMGGGYRTVFVSVPNLGDTTSMLVQYFIYALGPDDDFLILSAEAAYLEQIDRKRPISRFSNECRYHRVANAFF
jgi:hypothetical protein